MNRKFVTVTSLAGLMALGTACGSAPAPSKPAAPATSTAKPADTAKPKSNAPKKGLPENKKIPVPADWETMADESKGYEFQVPKDTTHKVDHVDGIDVYVAQTPKPSEIGIFVMAFKDKTLSRADLLKVAEKFLEGLGESEIKFGTAEDLSPDYALVEGTSQDKEKKKSKYKVLVATDKTDNYIMIVGTYDDKYEANKQIIDEIWGSFSMYSGGASGQS